jgi:hypothetical protein
MKIKSLRLALEQAATRSAQPGRAPASIFETGSTRTKARRRQRATHPQFPPPASAPTGASTSLRTFHTACAGADVALRTSIMAPSSRSGEPGAAGWTWRLRRNFRDRGRTGRRSTPPNPANHAGPTSAVGSQKCAPEGTDSGPAWQEPVRPFSEARHSNLARPDGCAAATMLPVELHVDGTAQRARMSRVGVWPATPCRKGWLLSVVEVVGTGEAPRAGGACSGWAAAGSPVDGSASPERSASSRRARTSTSCTRSACARS